MILTKTSLLSWPAAPARPLAGTQGRLGTQKNRIQTTAGLGRCKRAKPTQTTGAQMAPPRRVFSLDARFVLKPRLSLHPSAQHVLGPRSWGAAADHKPTKSGVMI